VPEKQTANSNFYEVAIKRLIARVHGIRPEFQESRSWYLLHDDAFFGRCARDLGETRDPMLSHRPYSPDIMVADFLSYLPN
jgi:hypothetical protein